uniref:Uncharacterized protein n=1 Tax=uncultured bacterium BLR12 TaxID=506514 RepID=C0INE5_9BACT|nr:hypothetical protein AKSOIL_0216 [uncultured bacterium BLR12]
MSKQTSLVSLAITFLLGIQCVVLPGYAQIAEPAAGGSVRPDSTFLTWLKDLYEPGVMVGDDSIFINKETARLLQDTQYQHLVYPPVYTWPAAISFIQKQELKKAFWYFINLYPINSQNKELVVKSILVYDKIYRMEKILVSTFYTYSLTDPEIGTIEQGHSKVTAPHIMEKKLNALKEMLFYLDKYKPEGRKENVDKP